MKKLLNILVAASSIFLGSILVFSYGPESLLKEEVIAEQAPADKDRPPAEPELKLPKSMKGKAKAKKADKAYRPEKQSKFRKKSEKGRSQEKTVEQTPGNSILAALKALPERKRLGGRQRSGLAPRVRKSRGRSRGGISGGGGGRGCGRSRGGISRGGGGG